MLKPLEQWYCDVCGEVIEKPEDGYVLWGHTKGEIHLETGFKIIHQSRCDNDRLPNSSHLPDFLGQDGLNKLLGQFLSIGPIQAHLSGPSGPRVADIDEFVDFFRRLQVPYYEQARCYFHDPEFLEQYHDTNEIQAYFPEVLKKIVEEYSSR